MQFVNRGAWNATKYSVLCSKHFSEIYIDRTSNSYVRLKDNAIPTLYPCEERANIEVTEPPTKVRIISNILIQSPYCQTNYEEQAINIASTSSGGVTTILKSKEDSEQGVYTSKMDKTVTPRKRKLLNKLDKAVRVNMERKREVLSLQRKLFRREKHIGNMLEIINELRTKKYLDVICKLGGPKELFIREYKKATKKALPRQYSEELKVFALTLH